MPSIVKPEDEIVEEPMEEVAADEATEEAPDFSGANADVIMPEDLDPATVLFEGGPTAGDVVKWKEQFGPVYVTEITFDEYIIWRTLKRSEYRSLVKLVSDLMQSGELPEAEINLYNEEAICRNCIIFPQMTEEEFDKQLAGMPTIISQQILEMSGFRPLDTRGL